MALFTFAGDPQKLASVDRTSFQDEGISEQEIQNALAHDISPLLENVLVICDEQGFWIDANRRVDLLCLDKYGNLIVVELKRDETAAQADLQALRYAAMVSAMSLKQLSEFHADYLSKSSGSAVSIDAASQQIRNFLGWNHDADESAFNENVRIVLAAANFSKELTTAVLWLNEKGVDIECHRIVPYRLGQNVVVDFHRVIPVPESDEFRIQLREKEEAKAAARRSSRDYTKYTFNGHNEPLVKRRLAYKVISEWVKRETPQSLEELNEAFPETLKMCGGALAVSVEEATRVENTAAGRRHFLEESERIRVGNEIYCITNQWGIRNIMPLISEAQRYGFAVEAVS